MSRLRYYQFCLKEKTQKAKNEKSKRKKGENAKVDLIMISYRPIQANVECRPN